MRGQRVFSPCLGNRARNGRTLAIPRGVRVRSPLFPGSPLGSLTADRLFFSTGAGLVASQYVVEIPVSWLYNNGVLWQSDM